MQGYADRNQAGKEEHDQLLSLQECRAIAQRIEHCVEEQRLNRGEKRVERADTNHDALEDVNRQHVVAHLQGAQDDMTTHVAPISRECSGVHLDFHG